MVNDRASTAMLGSAQTAILSDDRVAALARKFNAYELGCKTITLRGDAIVEFARALLAEHEASKIVPPIYAGQPNPGASIALPDSEGGDV